MTMLYFRYNELIKDCLLPSLTLLLIILVIINRRQIRLIYAYPKIKHLKYFPIIGHLEMYKYIWPSMNSLMYVINLLGKESGKMIFVPGFQCISISNAAHLDVVLTHPNLQKKHYSYDFLKGFLGDSILLINGKHWKEQRKAMNPTMHPAIISCYAEDMSKITNILISRFRQGKKTFDAMPDIGLCLMDIVSVAASGVSMNLQSDRHRTLVYYTDRYTELAVVRMFTPLLYPELIYRFTNAHRRQKEIVKYGKAITNKILHDKKTIYDKELANSTFKTSIEQTGRKRTFLDCMFDLHQNNRLFTEQVVRDELNTYLMAGFDTSTSAIGFTLLALAMFQEMQEQVYQEVMDVLGAKRLIEYSDLSKFVYLEKVIKESLRLFPPGPVLLRQPEEEFSLDGHIVPKNTMLICSILAIHRSPLYWKDPMTFDPERFTAEGIAKQVKNSYIPFSSGPRKCFGTRFAWMTMKIVVAAIIREFKVFTPYKSIEDIKLEWKITLKAKDGFLLRFVQRDQLNN